MPARFYLQSTGATPISPAFDAAWAVTAGAVRFPTSTTKAGTALNSASNGGGGGANVNVLCVQFVGPALAAQTISGTVKGQAVVNSFDPDTNGFSQCVIRVVSGDGMTVRGTLVAAHAAALSSEWPVAPRNRKIPLAALSPVTMTDVEAQAGDRLVIEIGARIGDNTIDAVEIALRDDLGSDLAENETSLVGDGNPWIEFSGTIATEGAPAARRTRGGLGLGLRLGI